MSGRDIIDYIDEEGEEGFVLKIDQRKAFDKVCHTYLFKLFEKFGFGGKFISWITIIYIDICISVKCNGFLNPYFMLKQSVRQGCPLSALLYIIAVEPLGIMLRNDENIHGITLPGSIDESLLYQHADDTTLTLADIDSVNNAMYDCQLYCETTGGEINMTVRSYANWYKRKCRSCLE